VAISLGYIMGLPHHSVLHGNQKGIDRPQSA